MQQSQIDYLEPCSTGTGFGVADFNYVGALERERMLEERPRVEGALDDLAQRAGYRLQRSAEAFAGRKLFLHYRSVLGPEERVEVDVNYLMRLPLGEGQRPQRGIPLLHPRAKITNPKVGVVDVDCSGEAFYTLALAMSVARPPPRRPRSRLDGGKGGLGVIRTLVDRWPFQRGVECVGLDAVRCAGTDR